jgi:hypothetical protein
LSDLDPDHFGISWWRHFPQLGTKRRILIADQLYVCAVSIEQNLAEAQLHRLEALDHRDHQAKQVARSAVLGREGTIALRHPERRCPADDLPLRLVTLHTAGFFRALVSALDCLGGTIVGVAGIPSSILKSDLSGALGWLGSRKVRLPRQRSLGDSLKTLIKAAGPTGWLDWATDYRNMLVHRGRRTHMLSIDVESHVLDQRGLPVLRSVPVDQLPAEPARSDIEALVSWKGGQPVLLEDADITMSGLFDSAREALSGAGTLLTPLWRERRANPTLITQPLEQWPVFPSKEVVGFKGYSPTRTFNPSEIRTNPLMVTRMKAAALHSDNRSRWDTFD